ncbi:MAG: hypothetical protein M3384_02605, partial [Acidobacteriota bacterium]|nr:hypothetical protein [Acidobacteriota bacterium]
MVHCQNCGQVNNYGSNFCRFCGARMVAAQTTPPPQQQQQQNQSYEYNPPKPYSWKTDEYQVQQQDAKTRRSQDIHRVQPLPHPSQPMPQALAYQQAPAMAHGYRCPRCGTQNLPHIERKISTAGWVVFAVLLVVFLPLFWIGLLIK